jgi:hypothetical protein
MPSLRHETERQHIGVRLSGEAVAEIDRLAARDAESLADRINRSEEIRRMLAFAHERMPAGWKPTRKAKVSFL